MNYYKLENKQMDRDFLDGRVVTCKATVPARQQAEGIVAGGQPIVIALSNGSKYKGRIVAFHAVVVDDHAVGELEIVRF